MKKARLSLSEKAKISMSVFGFSFVILVMIFKINNIVPWGEGASLLRNDLYQQYYPFLLQMNRLVHEGHDLSYIWSMGTGTGTSGIWSYYLACPFLWIAAIIPESAIISFVTLYIMVMISFAGAICSYVLKFIYPEAEKVIVFMGGLGFSFSGYFLSYYWNLMWLFPVAIFPLVYLGLRQLWFKNDSRLYIIVLMASIWSCYYISIPICIFCIGWIFVKNLQVIYLKKCKREKQNDEVFLLTKNIKFAVSSLLSGALCGAVLIPAVKGASGLENDRSITYYNGLYYNITEFFSNFACNVKRIQIGDVHYPCITLGILFFLFISILILNKNIPKNKKIAFGLFFVFFQLSFICPYLDYIWHGLRYPTSLPARESFIFLFMTIVYAVEFSQYKIETKSVSAITILSGILMFISLLTLNESFNTDNFTALYHVIFWIIYMVLFVLSVFRRKAALYIMAAMLIIECFFSGIFNYQYYPDADSFYKSEALQKVGNIEQNGEFYRSEITGAGLANNGVVANYNAVGTFSSDLREEQIQFFRKYGCYAKARYVIYDTGNPLLDAILGVKYLYTANEDNSDITIESKDTLPIGFITNGNIDSSETVKKYSNPYLALNELAAKILGIEDLYQNMASSRVTEEGILVKVDKPGTYSIYIASNENLYGFFNYNVFDLSWVDGNGNRKEECRDFGNPYLLDLGYLKEDTLIKVTLNEEMMADKESYSYHAVSAFIDEEVISSAVNNTTRLKNISVNGGYVTGSIKLSKSGTLFLTVPYDRNWQIYIDGKTADYSVFENMYYYINLAEGSHTITMKYIPYDIYVGLSISLLSLIALFILIPKKQYIRMLIKRV